MKVVMQRVKRATIHEGETQVASIGKGIVALIGFEANDGPKDMEKVIKKIVTSRIFENDSGVLWDWSVKDVDGEILCVSQFTLLASVKQGTKPNFRGALPPTQAEPLYLEFLSQIRAAYVPEKVSNGRFGSTCDVMLVNDGPTTILFDTKDGKQSGAATPSA